MRNFSYLESYKKLFTPEIISLLTKIHEFKGEQNLFIEENADKLNKLLEIAKIQSTEASNKIEGIYTSDQRLKKIVMDKTMPKTRNEEEIAGYRDVLNIIHENYEYIPIKPSMILQLHRDLYKHSGTSLGGTYKTSDNIIAEEDSDGVQHVRFQPVSAWETKDAMQNLCDAFNEAINKEIDPLLLIPMFILDFLCIHPFNDGNGRMSRLLTLLMLYQSDYIVGKYISVEKNIEKSKETYYEMLYNCSIGWHDNKNTYEPFVKYYLGSIVAAYREFESRVMVISKIATSKPDRIKIIIKEHIGKITKADLIKMCPDISQTTIQRTLAQLLDENKIIKQGGGRYTSYVWNWEEE